MGEEEKKGFVVKDKRRMDGVGVDYKAQGRYKEDVDNRPSKKRRPARAGGLPGFLDAFLLRFHDPLLCSLNYNWRLGQTKRGTGVTPAPCIPLKLVRKSSLTRLWKSG